MSKDIPVYDYQKLATDTPINHRWWTLEGDEIAKNLVPLVRDMENRQYYRRVQNLRNARLYSNQELMALQAGLFAQSGFQSLQTHRVTLNVIKSCIDTAASKIAKAKPRPMFLTIDGDETLQRRAKELTKYLDGAFKEMDIYPTMQRAFVDAGIFGTGPVKFYTEDGKVKCERTIVDQLFTDDAESVYGTPMQLHEIRYVSRDTLAEMFPKSASEIYAAASGMPSEFGSRALVDMIRVYESWKLPSVKGAKDGMHALYIDGHTLHAKQYRKSYFPFVFQRWNYKVTGFYGIGIAEELTGIQLELNKLLRTTQLSMHLMCVPRVFYDKNGSFDIGKFSNEIGGAYGYSGNPPIFNTSPAMPPEVYTHMENLYKKAFEIVGISMLSAASHKPAGLDSGVALREYQDIESDRFQLVGQRYEDAHMQAADIVIDMTRDLAASGKDPFVKVKDGKTISIIHWEDVDLEADQYDMRCFPTSILPTTPAGKLQTVQELVQAGFIDKDMALSLLDFPDLDAYVSNATASAELTNKLIENMIGKGEYEGPEPFEFLPQTKSMVQKSYLKAKLNGVSEERLELMRRFMADCDAIMNPPQPEAPAMAPMPGGPPAPGGPMPGDPLAGAMPPQAKPELAPRSDLMPNGGVVQ
jgi:hypothetical protein